MHRNGRGPSSVLAQWRVHGVSVQGYSHLRDGVECQDAHRHAEVPGSGAHVLAVADGAGSRPRSAEGSALAVGLATDTFVERVSRDGVPDGPGGWRRLLTAGHTAASSAFLAAVQRLGRDPRDFATTLTTVVWAPPWLGVASIGDGFVVARADGPDGGDDFHLVSYAGDEAEYVNETTFLTSARAHAAVRVDCLYDPGLSAVMVATDGLAAAAIRLIGGARRPNRSFLEPLLDGLDEPAVVARLLLDDRISALNADDKTLLVAVMS